MTTELLSVGTELLLGEIVDTNTAWLAQDLAQRGVDVYWSQRVGDNLPRLTEAIHQALARSDLLVMCGGLGPTDDDLSREALAAVCGETPQIDEGLALKLRARFVATNRPMPQKNLKQAWLIPAAEALPNPLGTAPGWLVRRPDGRRVVALPGPPRELQRMWLSEAVPRLSLPTSALLMKTFKTQGIGESAVAELLGELTLSANPSVATYAKRDGVHVRVAAKAASEAEAGVLAEPVLKLVRQQLGEYIWGSDSDELPTLLQQRLRERGETIASMESLTGGLIAQLLTAAAGASAAYRGGVVAYSAQAKAAFGVPRDLLERYGSVSEEAAHAMADAARRLFAGDYGLATTGVAGPETTEGKAVGEVYLALSGPRGVTVKQLRLPPLDREWIRERAAYTLLALLWSQLRA